MQLLACVRLALRPNQGMFGLGRGEEMPVDTTLARVPPPQPSPPRGGGRTNAVAMIGRDFAFHCFVRHSRRMQLINPLSLPRSVHR